MLQKLFCWKMTIGEMVILPTLMLLKICNFFFIKTNQTFVFIWFLKSVLNKPIATIIFTLMFLSKWMATNFFAIFTEKSSAFRRVVISSVKNTCTVYNQLPQKRYRYNFKTIIYFIYKEPLPFDFAILFTLPESFLELVR